MRGPEGCAGGAIPAININNVVADVCEFGADRIISEFPGIR